ncbi:MAG: DUF4367 domain-containing protein [Clostridiales bacterium]|jgi:hypothetical protein|nr:DUF4367 domain-containing protein [Clostridiales bacterium]
MEENDEFNQEILDRTFDDLLYTLVPKAEELIMADYLNNLDYDTDVTFSENHIRQMKKIFARERRKIFIKKLKKTSRYVAVFFVTVIVLFCASILSVRAWRLRFLEFIDTELTHLEVGNIIQDKSVNSYANDMLRFDYIPEGFSYQKDSYGEISDEYSISFVGEGQSFRLIVNKNISKILIDTEDSTMKSFDVNGFEANYSEKNGTNFLVWHNDEYYFQLSGNIPEVQLISIAENIEIKE